MDLFWKEMQGQRRTEELREVHRLGRSEKAKLLLLLSHFSRVRLCDPTDGSPPGSAVPGFLQARTLEWVAISFSNEGKWKVKVKSLSRGSSVHGIFQARVLEWGAIAFSKSKTTYI